MSEQLMKEILSELKTLNQRVGHIENDVAGVKTDINDLKTGQARLEANQSRLEEGLNKLEANQSRLEDGLNKLEANQSRLELLIENEVIEKIRALFDARQVHEDKFNLLIEGQEDIKTHVRYLVARVINLEKVAK